MNVYKQSLGVEQTNNQTCSESTDECNLLSCLTLCPHLHLWNCILQAFSVPEDPQDLFSFPSLLTFLASSRIKLRHDEVMLRAVCSLHGAVIQPKPAKISRRHSHNYKHLYIRNWSQLLPFPITMYACIVNT